MRVHLDRRGLFIAWMGGRFIISFHKPSGFDPEKRFNWWFHLSYHSGNDIDFVDPTFRYCGVIILGMDVRLLFGESYRKLYHV